jgi:hypothetical protein
MFLHVTNAKYVEVEVSFNNGRRGVADLSDALKGSVFEPLKNKSEFSSFTVDEELVRMGCADSTCSRIQHNAFCAEPISSPRQ